MKLLIVTQYYWPEFFLINRLSQKLYESGHQVTVITGKPNYPEGVIYHGYKAMGVQREDYEGVEVIRIPLMPRRKGAFGLILNYVSFVLSGMWYMPRLLKGRQFDAILVYAPSPITTTIPAIFMKRKLGAHLALWVQDLWPQSLSATGYVKNKLLLKLVVGMVKWIYKHVDTLLAQSQSFIRLIEVYANKDKLFYYPNSIEKQVKKSEIVPDFDVSCFDIGFSVVFAGNVGKAQSIPTLVKSAALFLDSECQLILVGDGSMLEWAKDEVLCLGLTNVHFVGRVDNRFMSWIYDHSDVLLVSLIDENIFSYTIPAKLQACLAAAKPIIASINGEAAEVIQASGAGLTCNSEDAEALAQCVSDVYAMSCDERLRMGEAGYTYFLEHFEMSRQAQHLIELLELRISQTRGK